MIAVSILLVYGTLKYIDTYTNHNQAVVVPDIRGLQVVDAEPFLEQNLLRYTIIDSVYSKDVAPGAIVELTPEANAKVKKNRIIYITINANTEKTVFLPEVKDFSFREAYARLKSLGFKDVELKYVSGEFRDLTIGVEYNDKMVDSVTRVPLTATLILVVSDGHIIPLENDSIMDEKPVIIESNENWF
jgi:beta-lactam-binding protein with PASTA domain